MWRDVWQWLRQHMPWGRHPAPAKQGTVLQPGQAVYRDAQGRLTPDRQAGMLVGIVAEVSAKRPGQFMMITHHGQDER